MIILNNICKSYGEELVLENLCLKIDSGLTLSVTGRSGCGKTTLLKIMAGLEKADKGTFTVNGVSIFELPIQERKIMYLSQEPLLFPHINVFENIAYGLRVKGLSKSHIKDKVVSLAEQVNVQNLLNKDVGQLSGGQKQRVSFARSLVIEPNMLLLDEPFGSLDNETRDQMCILFKKLTIGVSVFFITHDLKEAITVGNIYGKIEGHNLVYYDSLEKMVKDVPDIKKEAKFWEKIGLM